mmetsp:Transcript_60507/g.148813  ORF Transcript_60507/g.148813 Transcript_60507/m.148813 type:complete len:257 (-) Transcript_60507:536-1306(-)
MLHPHPPSSGCGRGIRSARRICAWGVGRVRRRAVFVLPQDFGGVELLAREVTGECACLLELQRHQFHYHVVEFPVDEEGAQPQGDVVNPEKDIASVGGVLGILPGSIVERDEWDERKCDNDAPIRQVDMQHVRHHLRASEHEVLSKIKTSWDGDVSRHHKLDVYKPLVQTQEELSLLQQLAGPHPHAWQGDRSDFGHLMQHVHALFDLHAPRLVPLKLPQVEPQQDEGHEHKDDRDPEEQEVEVLKVCVQGVSEPE